MRDFITVAIIALAAAKAKSLSKEKLDRSRKGKKQTVDKQPAKTSKIPDYRMAYDTNSRQD